MLLKREVEISSDNIKNCILHFFITSSHVIYIQLIGKEYDLPFEEIDDMSIFLDLSSIELKEKRSILNVFYEGEPISLAGLEYNLSSKEIDKKKEEGTLFRNIFKKQRIIFERLNNPIHKKYHLFFYDLRIYLADADFAAEDMLSAEDKLLRRTAISAMNELLFERFLYRGYSHQTGKDAEGSFLMNTRSSKAYLEYLSEIYMQVFATYFIKNESGELNVEQIDEAFVMYNNGSLKLDNHHFSQPLSAFGFLLTEFAFLAVDLDIHSEFWGPMLPTLVKAQEIYSTVYKPEGKPPFVFGDYTINNFDRQKQYSKSELNSLNYQYSLKTYEDLLHEVGLQIYESFTGYFEGAHTKYSESEIVTKVGRMLKKSIIGSD